MSDVTRAAQLPVLLLLACACPTSPSPNPGVAPRASEGAPEPPSPGHAREASPSDPVGDRARTRTDEPAAGTTDLPEWRDDPRILAQLRKAHDAPPKTLDRSSIVAEADLHIDLLRSMWDEAGPEQDLQSRTYRVHLLVGQAKQAHLVELALQERSPGYSLLGAPTPPPVADTRWRGAGSKGPDLVLTVSTASLWGTQCRDGQDARRDLILCDVEAEQFRCARAPLDLIYFDGCGGAEAYDDGPGEEERCARVAFTSSWRTGAEELYVTTHDAVDVDCIDLDADGSIGSPRRPLPSPLDYTTLLDDHGLEVMTLKASP